MADFENIWQNILIDIKSNINIPTYKTWFEHIVPISLNKNSLTVSVGSSFAKEWLESRYLSLINSSAKKITGGSCKVKIITRPPVNNTVSEYPDLVPDSAAQGTQMAKPKTPVTVFNTKYTFDSFVVGTGNRFACTASLAVSENPGKTYNPLFIYGGVGLGKTHLLHAIGHYTLQLFPEKTIKYVSAERFLNDFINALRYKNIQAFKESYRNNDILLVDDIQFLEEKEASQEEFFHTFNTLHDTNRQIVLSSDRPPRSVRDHPGATCRQPGGLRSHLLPGGIRLERTRFRRRPMQRFI